MKVIYNGILGGWYIVRGAHQTPISGIAKTVIINTSQQGVYMSALNTYLDRKNAFAKMFGQKALSLQNATDRQRIADSIDADLSPENLTCDGELPRSQVQARYRALTAAAKELQKLDPSVKFYEFV